MALMGKIVTQDGVEHKEAYAKIVKVEFDSLTKFISILVNIYHNKQTRDELKNPVKQKYFNVRNGIVTKFNEDGSTYQEEDNKFDEFFDTDLLNQSDINIIKQGYAFIKTQEDFENWQDA